MHFDKRYLLLLLLSLLLQNLSAETIVVTSNADDGPGTFREALTKAKLNGTQDADRIVFDLPFTSDEQRTILIVSQLPEVSSNLIIDGTSQPGTNLGSSHAKVFIKSVRSTITFSILKGTNISDLSVYGIHFLDTGNPLNSDPDAGRRKAIDIANGTNLIIGDLNKGNVFNGYNTYSIMLSNSSNVKMYDNIVGQSAFKVDYVNTAPILLQGIKNADIGDINKGNTFLSRITLEVSKESKLNVLNNNFGVSTDGLTVYHIFDDSWLQIKPYFAPGQPTDHPAIDVKITSNLFSHYTDGGVSITSVDGKIEISDNYFGIDRTGTIPLNTKKAHPGAGEAINLFVVKADVVIGSEDPLKGNRFAYTAYAIDAAGTHNVKLIRNSFKCISAYDYHLSGPKIPLPQIEIKEETEKYIRGVTVPGATVDIFLSDDCPRCSPYTYIGTLTASATGDWRYDFAIAPGRKIIANAHVGPMSSEFTKPAIITTSIKITNYSCLTSGSIIGVQITNTDKFRWVDDKGNTVSEEADLKNAAPGKYKLITGTLCPVESEWFQIDDFRLQIDDKSRKVVNPTCNTSNGSITNLVVFSLDNSIKTYSWVNADQKEVATTLDLKDVGVGSYTLFIKNTKGCTKTYGPVLLGSSEINIGVSAAIITGSNCGSSGGSIKNVTINAANAYSIIWRNEQQETVGTGNELINVKGGKYSIEVKDVNGCSSYGNFSVPEINGITIDDSALLINAAVCGTANGSITNIRINGATAYFWVNEKGVQVSQKTNLLNAAAGIYKLLASNSTCTIESKYYEINQLPGTVFNVNPISGTDAYCGGNNGTISVAATGNQPKSFRWINSAGTTIGNTSSLINAPAGEYKLFLTDDNGCESFYKNFTVRAEAVLAVDHSLEKIVDDECAQKLGRINGIKLAGGMPPYSYSWTDPSGKTVGNSVDLNNVSEGIYQLTVKDAHNCNELKLEYTIKNNNSLLSAPIVPDIQVCSAGEVSLVVKNTTTGVYRLYSSPLGSTVVSENNSGIFKINVSESVDYYMSYAKGGCESSRTKIYVGVGINGVNIANTVTPNGDGVNDEWLLNDIASYPLANIVIYNRYGQIVYRSRGYTKPFNGTANGQELSQGTYYYSIELAKECKTLSGSLTLIR